MLTDTKIAAIKPPASGQEEHADHKVTGLRLRVGSGGKKSWTLRRRVGPKIINRKLGSYPAMGLAAARSAAEKMIDALERDGDDRAASTGRSETLPITGSRRSPREKRQLARSRAPTRNARLPALARPQDCRDQARRRARTDRWSRRCCAAQSRPRHRSKRFSVSRSLEIGLTPRRLRASKSRTDETRARPRARHGRNQARLARLRGCSAIPLAPCAQMLLLTAQRRS